MRLSAWILVTLSASSASVALAANDIASSPPSVLPGSWSQWQGRVLLGSGPAGPGRLGVPSARTAFSSASLMGDYYFGRSLVSSQVGGFRATSGLVIGPRSSFALGDAARVDGSGMSMGRRTLSQSALLPGNSGGDSSTTTTYLGFGYTGSSLRGGWAYSADLGLAGTSTRLGHPFGGGPNMDDAIRDMRMGPLVQVGVSYAF